MIEIIERLDKKSGQGNSKFQNLFQTLSCFKSFQLTFALKRPQV